MWQNLTFNHLVVPLILTCVFVLSALAFLVKVRREAHKTAQKKRLDALKPPRKGRNHRSLPPRQYYLTKNMAKPTEEEEHILNVVVKLTPEGAPGVSAR